MFAKYKVQMNFWTQPPTRPTVIRSRDESEADGAVRDVRRQISGKPGTPESDLFCSGAGTAYTVTTQVLRAT
jgi:hypothetical protein